MINFWVNDRDRFTIGWRPAASGAPIVSRVAVQPYEGLARRGMLSGSGLGLSICRKLVETMGGQMQVETAAGEGTRFHFVVELPRAGIS